MLKISQQLFPAPDVAVFLLFTSAFPVTHVHSFLAYVITPATLFVQVSLGALNAPVTFLHLCMGLLLFCCPLVLSYIISTPSHSQTLFARWLNCSTFPSHITFNFPGPTTLSSFQVLSFDWSQQNN